MSLYSGDSIVWPLRKARQYTKDGLLHINSSRRGNGSDKVGLERPSIMIHSISLLWNQLINVKAIKKNLLQNGHCHVFNWKVESLTNRLKNWKYPVICLKVIKEWESKLFRRDGWEIWSFRLDYYSIRPHAALANVTRCRPRTPTVASGVGCSSMQQQLEEGTLLVKLRKQGKESLNID